MPGGYFKATVPRLPLLEPAFTPEPDMSMSFRSAFVAFALVLLPSSAALSAVIRDGAVSGRVTDRAGQPIADASVSIAELAQSATTGKDGRFGLGTVPRGRYMMSIRRLGFVSIAKLVDVANAAVVVDVTMDAGAVRMEPVNVTASRRPIAAVGSPLDASALTGEQVHPEGGISLAHSVAQLPGARVVSSGEQIGKPMIRGLFGPRVLVLGNGSRLEDYSWSDEDGPSIDARLARAYRSDSRTGERVVWIGGARRRRERRTGSAAVFGRRISNSS